MILSSEPYNTLPFSSTSQMYLTHNGEIISLVLSIQQTDPVDLALDS